MVTNREHGPATALGARASGLVGRTYGAARRRSTDSTLRCKALATPG
jgi:hypothetical protein